MATAVYIGIDPGTTGGLAVLRGDKLTVAKMPETDRDVWNWFSGFQLWINHKDKPYAVVEKVGGFIRGNPAPGSAMFNFGRGYGRLLMALTAAAIPFEEVPPQRWMKYLGIPTRTPHDKTRSVVITRGKNKGKTRVERYGGETDVEFKNRLRAKAQQLFPAIDFTLATCDAAILAEYCRRVRTGVRSADPALPPPVTVTRG